MSIVATPLSFGNLVPESFGAGIFAPEAPTDAYGNRLPWGPTDADLAEYREWVAERESIERAEWIEHHDREVAMAEARERDEARRWEDLAELEELASRFDAVCHA